MDRTLIVEPFVRLGPVHLGARRDDVRAIIPLPRQRTRFPWTQSFGRPGDGTWFVGYDDVGTVIHVEAHPNYDPVTIPAGVVKGISWKEVLTIAGRPTYGAQPRDHFSDERIGSLSVTYDPITFTVTEVEVARNFDPVFDGIHLLTTVAEEVLARIPYELGGREDPRLCPRYPAIEMGLWRPMLPEKDPEDDTEVERLPYFQSMAIGVRRAAG